MKIKHYQKLITFWLDKESVEKIDRTCKNKSARAEWLRDAVHEKLSRGIRRT